MKNQLEEYRKIIDQLDQDLIEAISKRLQVVKEVGKYKKDNNLPPLAPERWQAVLDKVSNMARDGEIPPELVVDFYNEMHEEALLIEGAKEVYSLGPIGSYSYQITEEMFPVANHLIRTIETFEAVTEIVDEANVIGVLAVENSITSNVHTNMDYLFTQKYKIIKEGKLKIVLNLAGNTDDISKIFKVYSHPKALAQCSKIIEEMGWVAVPANSTSEALEMVKETGADNIAAIGSAYGADEYDLNIIKADIGNHKNNQTRFVAITQPDYEYQTPEDADKMTVICDIKHEVGSLNALLAELSNAQANLSKIESRPIPDTDWSYRFLLDIEYSDYAATIAALESKSEKFNEIGRYKISKTYSS